MTDLPTDSDQWYSSAQAKDLKTTMTADWGAILNSMSDLPSPAIPPGSTLDHRCPPSPTGVMDFNEPEDSDFDDLDGLDDIFSALANDVVVRTQSIARTIGVDGDTATLHRVLAKGAMADSGANVCITPDSSNIINIRNIPPVSLNLALDDGTSQSFDSCTKMGYLPFTRTDGTEHLQPFQI